MMDRPHMLMSNVLCDTISRCRVADHVSRALELVFKYLVTV